MLPSTACPFAPKLAQFDASNCIASYDNINRDLCNLIKETLDPYQTDDSYHGAAFRLALIARPQTEGKLISLFLSVSDMENNNRTTGKAGKLLRKAFPFVSPKSAESFAVAYKDRFYTPTQGLVVKASTSPDDFARVYTMAQAPASDPKLGNGLSSLSASCMRYKFSHLALHPCAVYGTGDFQIVWVENGSGQLMSRCVVAIRDERFAPSNVYTNSDIATKTIQDYLNAGSDKAQENVTQSWVNCRLLKVESNGGFLAPYLDHFSGAVESRCGDFWRITNGQSDIEFITTSGEAGGCECNCESCGDGLHEEEGFYVQDQTVCESCYCENFTHCDSCEEVVSNEDIVPVCGTHDNVCDYCARNDSEIYELDTPYDDASYIHSDAAIIDVQGSVHHIDADTWFVSNADDEVYHIDDLADVPTQNLTQMQAIEWYTLTTVKSEKLGTYGQTVKTTTRVYTLKPWLELNSCGDIVDRQLELDI